MYTEIGREGERERERGGGKVGEGKREGEKKTCSLLTA